MPLLFPLNGTSLVLLHLLQNLALIAISLAFVPLITTITALSLLLARYHPTTKQINHHRQWRHSSSATFRPRTVLVTGVGMSKGLSLARTFYRAGHTVIGADFEPYDIPVCGRFSRALKRFYRVRKPVPENGGVDAYVRDLIDIVREEGVDLWVSCSGVASAVEDGVAKEAIEKSTGAKCLQFGVGIIEILHEKDSFIENTRKIGLNVPSTHLVVHEDDALAVLHPEANGDNRVRDGDLKYIIKFVGTDDLVRADMTLLPLSTREKTSAFIRKKQPSPARPFVLQQYISGPEYCTHSIAIAGKIKVFTACESADVLMHYKALPTTSTLYMSMLEYTEKYATAMGSDFTGHFSLDFLVPSAAVTNTSSKTQMMDNIYPIECNPRAHTACVLFADSSEEVAEAYLSLLPDHKPESHGHKQHSSDSITQLNSSVPGYYWIGHDIITRLILPALYMLLGQMGLKEVMSKWVEFVVHVTMWKDGTYEVWDPLPLWWLYCVYWPGMFLVAIYHRSWWSRCNVSTTKMFRC